MKNEKKKRWYDDPCFMEIKMTRGKLPSNLKILFILQKTLEFFRPISNVIFFKGNKQSNQLPLGDFVGLGVLCFPV